MNTTSITGNAPHVQSYAYVRATHGTVWHRVFSHGSGRESTPALCGNFPGFWARISLVRPESSAWPVCARCDAKAGQ